MELGSPIPETFETQQAVGAWAAAWVAICRLTLAIFHCRSASRIFATALDALSEQNLGLSALTVTT